MESELLPCPFCGETAKQESHTDVEDLYVIRCMTCEIRTEYHSLDMAIKIWNTRANKAEQPKAGEAFLAHATFTDLEKAGYVLAELKEWLEIRDKECWDIDAFSEALDKIKELQGE